MFIKTTLPFDMPPRSLNWQNNHLIDWVGGGNIYTLDGKIEHSHRRYSYKFDAAIQSDNGVYVVIYEKLGTKGLLLKNGKILRELNRSYYQAHVYEYPIAFLRLPDGAYALVHCPEEYCLLEIELVESGEKITSPTERQPADCFHSRLQMSPSNTYLLNTGWVWHPYGIIEWYDIQKGIVDNSVFDKMQHLLEMNIEVNAAAFLNDDLILIGTSHEEGFEEVDSDDAQVLDSGQIGLFSISQQQFLKKINVTLPIGTLIPWSEDVVINLFDYPQVIDLNTGTVLQVFEEINTGRQVSSIIHYIDKVPPIAIDQQQQRIAIGTSKGIELLQWKETKS